MSARTCDRGRADHGSRRQIQNYVNWWPGELSRHVLDALPSLASLNPFLRWVSPLESEDFAEYGNGAFLDALGLGHLRGPLADFWPERGPCWDALAVVDIAGDAARKGVVLVEAKSYPQELRGPGCKAESGASRKMIQEALERTRRWLGVAEHFDWTGDLYQYANRLAHLYFFRLVVGIPAWLVNVYFVGDPRSPTRREEWQVALDQAKAELGLAAICVPHTADVFVEAQEHR